MTSPLDPEKAGETRPFLVEVSSDDSISPSDVVPEADNKRRSLFFLVYTVCVLFYLHILSRIVGVNWSGWSRTGEDQLHFTDHNSLTQCLDSINFTVVATPWSTGGYVYRAHTSTSLPVFSEELSFVALGDLSYGTFQISQSPDVDSEAIVDITMLYHQPEVLDNATMCRLHPSHSKWGLGIFTPNWFGAELEHKVQVDINVRLPANVDPRKPLAIKGLRTYLPQYTHIIPDLSQSVHFGKIHLTSRDGGVAAESLSAATIKVQSGIGPITGTYNATNALVLDTANAPIAVRANLLGGDDRVVHLYMKTSNGFIDSQIGLYSNASDSTGGTFTVSARTANSLLKLDFVDTPVDAVLRASAGTSNSPAQVRLHEAYEGAFSLLGSTFFRPLVEWDKSPEDPAGHGRKRTVKVNAVKDSLVTGHVYWGEKEGAREKGSVSVETSNSRLRLVL